MFSRIGGLNVLTREAGKEVILRNQEYNFGEKPIFAREAGHRENSSYLPAKKV